MQYAFISSLLVTLKLKDAIARESPHSFTLDPLAVSRKNSKKWFRFFVYSNEPSNCFCNRDHPWLPLLHKLPRFHYRFASKSPGLRISMLLKLYLVMNFCIEWQCSNHCHVFCDLNSPRGIDSKAESKQAQNILPGHLQLVLMWISILNPFSLFLIYCSSKVRIVNHPMTRKR